MSIRREIRSFSIAVAVAVGFCVVAPVATPTAAAAGNPIQSVVPARLADTRLDGATIDGQFARIGERTARSRTEIKIAGRGNVPLDATAVMLNLTDVQLKYAGLPKYGNFLTVYPCTAQVPNASNLNTPAGDIRANNVFVKLSAHGTVCVYSERSTDFIIDVNGYVPAGGSAQSLNPARLFDSRPGEKTVDGKFAGGGRLLAGSRTKIQIAGRGGVPLEAASAIINVTDVLPTGGNLLKVYPCTDELPDASSVNTPVNDIRANNVYVGLSDGAVCVYTVRDTNFVLDVGGYVLPDGTPSTLSVPTRLFDSRAGEKTVDGDYQGGGRVGPGSTTEIQIAGRGGVRGDSTVAVINLTSIFPATGNYLTAYPCDAPRPNASTVNSPTGDIRANGAVVKLSPKGTICVYSVYETDFIVDASGYSDTPPIPLRILGDVCWNQGQVLNSVDYYNSSLNATVAIGAQTSRPTDGWPETYMGYAPSGGTPPYTYEAIGLTGYSMNKQTGAITNTGGSKWPVSFSLVVTDAAGTKIGLPATVTWEPTATVNFDYQAFLPNGHTIAAPQPINWGAKPFTYAWVGPGGVRINPATGDITYTTNNNKSLEGEVRITDSTGAVTFIKTSIKADDLWAVNLPADKKIVVGEPIGQFNPSGWGSAPYSYALTGDNANAFSINSAGQLSVTNAAPLQQKSQSFWVTVTDASGKQLVVAVSVMVGPPFRLPFIC